MGSIKEKLARFMSGRYGADQLYYFCITISFILIIANSFIRSSIISSLTWVILILILFRIFSRNIYKRRMENEKFLKLWNPSKAKLSLTIRRIKEIRTHRFRKCPNCKKVLRLPRRKGKHTVNCPCCNSDFELNIFF